MRVEFGALRENLSTTGVDLGVGAPGRGGPKLCYGRHFRDLAGRRVEQEHAVRAAARAVHL